MQCTDQVTGSAVARLTVCWCWQLPSSGRPHLFLQLSL
jgi:hypothetical protein